MVDVRRSAGVSGCSSPSAAGRAQLWNWLLPAIFGWRQVTFWQALGMLALCRILFGGLGRHGGYRSKRWEHMTPEERERFRQGMRAPPGSARRQARARANEPHLRSERRQR